MPLTVKYMDKQTGRFDIWSEGGSIIGHGRAKVSRTPGMITLFFPEHVIGHIINGIRVPINWIDHIEMEVGASDDK